MLSRWFLLVISNGSWQYYSVLLKMLVASSCINYILLRKGIPPKSKMFQFLTTRLLTIFLHFNNQIPLKNSKIFCL